MSNDYSFYKNNFSKNEIEKAIRGACSRLRFESSCLDDIRQELFLKIVSTNGKHPQKQIDHPKAYLGKTATNTALTFIENRNKIHAHERQTESMDEIYLFPEECSRTSPEVQNEKNEHLKRISIFMPPNSLRGKILRKALEGFSYSEIAAMLRISNSSVTREIKIIYALAIAIDKYYDLLFFKLTLRQQKILKEAEKNKTGKEIAKALKISRALVSEELDIIRQTLEELALKGPDDDGNGKHQKGLNNRSDAPKGEYKNSPTMNLGDTMSIASSLMKLRAFKELPYLEIDDQQSSSKCGSNFKKITNDLLNLPAFKELEQDDRLLPEDFHEDLNKKSYQEDRLKSEGINEESCQDDRLISEDFNENANKESYQGDRPVLECFHGGQISKIFFCTLTQPILVANPLLVLFCNTTEFPLFIWRYANGDIVVCINENNNHSESRGNDWIPDSSESRWEQNNALKLTASIGSSRVHPRFRDFLELHTHFEPMENDWLSHSYGSRGNDWIPDSSESRWEQNVCVNLHASIDSFCANQDFRDFLELHTHFEPMENDWLSHSYGSRWEQNVRIKLRASIDSFHANQDFRDFLESCSHSESRENDWLPKLMCRYISRKASCFADKIMKNITEQLAPISDTVSFSQKMQSEQLDFWHHDQLIGKLKNSISGVQTANLKYKKLSEIEKHKPI